MYNRIDTLLKQKNIKRTKFCADNGFASSTYSEWKYGRRKPNDLVLERIADYLGVSLEYLKYGKDIERNMEKGELIAKITSDFDFMDKIIKLYNLPAEDQERAFHLITMLCNHNK